MSANTKKKNQIYKQINKDINNHKKLKYYTGKHNSERQC